MSAATTTSTGSQAMSLADELERLLDAFEIEDTTPAHEDLADFLHCHRSAILSALQSPSPMEDEVDER
jgi:hypothetical protein